MTEWAARFHGRGGFRSSEIGLSLGARVFFLHLGTDSFAISRCLNGNGRHLCCMGVATWLARWGDHRAACVIVRWTRLDPEGGFLMCADLLVPAARPNQH